MSEHDPNCDVNDANPDGIRKPCNCAKSEFASSTGSACPHCLQVGKYVRDRGFSDESGHVWMCANQDCVAHMLYYYGKPLNPRTNNQPTQESNDE